MQTTTTTATSEAATLLQAINSGIYKGYHEYTLKAVFHAVCDSQDWKRPVACTAELTAVGIVVAAIEYYTATVPTVELDNATGVYRITSVGYRMGPAGDH